MSDRVSTLSLPKRLTILATVLLVCAAVIGCLGVLVFGSSLQIVLIAFVPCLVGALLAHVAGEYPKGDLYIMARMAVQIVVRTLPPFVVAVWALYFAQPPLEKSLVFYMILFYLIGLVMDVQMSLARLKTE